MFCHFLPRVLLVAALIALMFVSGREAWAGQETEQSKISYLLDVVQNSDLVFIHNGSEYSSQEAAAYLRDKMGGIGMRVHTVEDFIRYVAGTSSTTGISNYVRFADGTQIEASIWLRRELDDMKANRLDTSQQHQY